MSLYVILLLNPLLPTEVSFYIVDYIISYLDFLVLKMAHTDYYKVDALHTGAGRGPYRLVNYELDRLGLS